MYNTELGTLNIFSFLVPVLMNNFLRFLFRFGFLKTKGVWVKINNVVHPK